jgi:hypothetical protein
MFRLGGNVRQNYQNGTDLSDIEKLIGETSAARAKAIGGIRSALPLSVLAGQMDNIRTIRKPGDVLNILSNIGGSPELIGALTKLPSLDLKMKEGELADKIKLATIRSKALGSSTRMKSEAQIRNITKEIQNLEAKKEVEKDPTKLKVINNELEQAKNALKAYINENLRIRAVDELSGDLLPGQTLSEEDIQRRIELYKGADGGRVGFQEGTPDPTLPQPKPKGPMDDRKVENLMKAAPALENPGEVKQMAMKDEDVFAALRRRLPQEITDDVVRLIAYNPEAFADFADISDQSDVDSFNEKYNVQLVLPVENVT